MSSPRFVMVLVAASVIGLSGCSTLKGAFNRDKAPDSGPKMSEQAYYEQAQKSLQRGEFDNAARSLEALDTYYPVGPYTEQAQLDLMYSRFRLGDYPGAVGVADRIIRLYPNSRQLDYVYYVRGVANMETGYDSLLRYTRLNQAHRDTSMLRLAYDNFTDFLKRFPSSRYSADVTQRLRHIVNQMAESEMNIARFSLERKAWLAAAQRARWVLEYYPQTPQIPEALATLVYSYQKLGQNDLAAPHLAVLKANYPQLLDGDSVRLSRARTDQSWLNKLTFGIAGRRSELIVPPSSTAAVTAPAAATSAPVLPATPEQTPSIVTVPQLRLGLPDQPAVNSISDPLPVPVSTPADPVTPGPTQP